MAARIKVLRSASNDIDHHVKRTTARALVASLLFAWVIEGVSIRAIPSKTTVLHLKPFTAKLPPAEVGGCRFKGPEMQETDVVHLVRIRHAQKIG